MFRIVLAEHEECESDYLAHVDALLEKRRTLEERGPALPPFDMLDIHSQNTTAAPTAPRSPDQGCIYIMLEDLGRGAYGVVSKVVDVSDGCMYAGKEFFWPGWERDVAAMRKVSHVRLLRLCVRSINSLQERIIQFVDFSAEPKPLLVMEYLPLGSLYDQHRDAPIVVEEAVTLFYERLQGIDYLHTSSRPMSLLCLAHHSASSSVISDWQRMCPLRRPKIAEPRCTWGRKSVSDPATLPQ